MRRMLIYICMIIMLLTTAAATYPISWGEYMDGPANYGFVHDEFGDWDNVGTFSTSTEGVGYAAVAFDIDNDDTKEIVTGHGNYVNIFTAADNILVLEDSFNLGAAFSAAPTIVPDTDGDGLYEIVAFNSSGIYHIKYNESGFSTLWSSAIATPYSAPRCLNNSGQIACYYLVYDTANTYMHVANLTAQTIDYALLSAGGDGIAGYSRKAPAAGILHDDGHMDMVFIVNWNGDARHDIAVFDTYTMALDTQFSGDGVYDALTSALPAWCGYADLSVTISGLMIYNVGGTESQYEQCIDDCEAQYACNSWFWNFLDCQKYAFCTDRCNIYFESSGYGGGDPEIVATINQAPAAGWVGGLSGLCAATGLYYWKSDGTFVTLNNNLNNALWAVDRTLGAAVETYSTSPLVGPFLTSQDNWEYCAFSMSNDAGSDTGTILACVLENTSKSFFADLSTSSASYITGNLAEIFAADMDSDGFDEIVTGTGIIKLNSATNFTFTPFGNTITTPYNAIGTDLNNDNNIDVIGTVTSSTFAVFSTFDNVPPTVNASFGTSLCTASPICINTYLTFYAQECGGIEACNYGNDLAVEQERITSNCGYYDDYTTGDYDLASPEFTCFFNETGLYNVRLYMQDLANDDAYTLDSSYQHIISVQNGTPGVSCNLICAASQGVGDDSIASASAEAAASEEAVQSMTDIMTGGSTYVKGVISGLVILGATIGLLLLHVHIVGVVLVNFLISVILWMWGFMTILVAIFIAIGSIFVVLLKLAFSHGDR